VGAGRAGGHGGKVELLIFPEAYKKLAEKVKLEVPVLIRGGVRIEEGANPKVTANEIIPLDEARVPLRRRCASGFRSGARPATRSMHCTRSAWSAKARPRCFSTWSATAISWW